MSVLRTLHHTFLTMLAEPRQAQDLGLGELDAGDWAWIGGAARRHRLQSLLHQNATRPAINWPLPDWLANEWHHAHRVAGVRALNRQMTMRRVAGVLDAEGIAYAGLKGIWLAWHAYPNPAIRPMCDVDVLVARDDAPRAYAALLSAGFIGKSPESAAFGRALNGGSRHLPPLFLPQTTSLVEVHFGLTGKAAQTADCGAFDNSARLLSRRVWHKIGDVRLSYLNPTDCLLHLIVHATYDHRMDSGPQVLCDIAALIQAEAIDWPSFWSMAERGGYGQGAGLLFALAEQVLGVVAIDWQDGEATRPPEPVLQAALRYVVEGGEVDNTKLHLLEEIEGSGGFSQWLRHNAHRFFPDRDRLAEFGHINPADRAAWSRAYRLYPAWVGQHLVKLARTLWGRAGQDRQRGRAAINAWLDAVGTGP